MFDTKKFGAYISRLRKNVDMTQSELADKLNLTRQAISKYETGDSFPDISILINIAEIFGITIDKLINAGEPSKSEAKILKKAANKEEVTAESVSDLINLAPLLKPSMLDNLAKDLLKQGIDISNIVALAEFMNDNSVIELLKNASFESASEELIEKLMPFLDEKSKNIVIAKILEGEYDWRLIKSIMPYIEYMTSQIEEAVVEGALPWEVIEIMHKYRFATKGY